VKRPILVTGASGQVGIEVSRLQWPAAVDLLTPSRDELNISDADSVASYFAANPPTCVINLAAYTAVDRAEEEVAAAFLVNAQGPAILAEAARRAGAPIVHVSTDYVFDGTSAAPYSETDPTRPINAYGASKLAGELAVRAANPRAVILRTAWVVSARRTNFLKTMLRLANSTPELRIIADQRGCPTSAHDIAVALQKIALHMIDDPDGPGGVYHFVNAGDTSWHGLAEHIFNWQAAQGSARPKVTAILTADYPTPARRPANSRLNTALIGETFGIHPRPWQQAIDEILSQLPPLNREQGNNE
jgi:dTDP-4-dehydrorhamnose reductase